MLELQTPEQIDDTPAELLLTGRPASDTTSHGGGIVQDDDRFQNPGLDIPVGEILTVPTLADEMGMLLRMQAWSDTAWIRAHSEMTNVEQHPSVRLLQQGNQA